MSISAIVISAILSFVLLTVIFPTLIYVLSETVLIFTKIIDYSESKKDNWTNLLIIRLFYLIVFLISWVIIIGLYIPMQILIYIEVFGGFVDDEIMCGRE